MTAAFETVKALLHMGKRPAAAGLFLRSVCCSCGPAVTRTGIEDQKGVVPVEPGTSDMPPAYRIQMGSIPVLPHYEKNLLHKQEVFLMVTRTGIEPMLPP